MMSIKTDFVVFGCTLVVSLLSVEPALSAVSSRGEVGLIRTQSDSLARRWRDFMAENESDSERTRKNLAAAKSSSVWEKRAAAVAAAVKIDPELAEKWAIELLQDPALLVRLAAVDALKELRSKNSTEALWQALEDPKNYRKGKSLFIRARIVEALDVIEPKAQRARFEPLMHDPDSQVKSKAQKRISL